MAKRYGRNQRRAHRAEIEALKAKLYGAWGEPPAHLPELTIRPIAKYIRTREARDGIATTVDLTFVADDMRQLNELVAAHQDRTVYVYEHMCLYPVRISQPSIEKYTEPFVRIEVEFQRVRVAA